MGYTPELAQLIGFEDDFPQVVSDTQAYRQAGNSVVPQVVIAVAQEILQTMKSATSPDRAVAFPEQVGRQYALPGV